MNEYVKAAIIGFWRSGATTEQICVVTGLFYPVIQKIINDYKRELNYQKKALYKNFLIKNGR